MITFTTGKGSTGTHLQVPPGHVGDIHIVCGRTDVFMLFTREYIDTDEVHLGMAVFASLGRRHLDYLARTPLQ